jgi:large subunit ribosomal protein L37Ae
MSRRTKKVGVAGRLGARYGLSVRKQVKNIETEQKKKHECPRCHHLAVKRVSTGIWSCRHCDLKFAGGAYAPTTAVGRARMAASARTLGKEEAAGHDL